MEGFDKYMQFMANCQKDFSEQQKQLKDAEERNLELRSDLEQQRTKSSVLQSQLEHAQVTIKNLQQIEEKSKITQNEKEQLQVENSQLKSQLEESENSKNKCQKTLDDFQAQLECQVTKCSQLRTELKHAQDTIKRLQEIEKRTLNETMVKQQNEIQQVQKEKSDLESKLEASENGKREYQEEIQIFQIQLERQVTNCSKLRTDLEKAEKTIKGKEQKLTESERIVSEKQRAIQEAEEKLKKAQQFNYKLTKKSLSLEKEIREKKMEIEELERCLSNERLENTDVQDKFQWLKESVFSLSSEFAEFIEEIKTSEQSREDGRNDDDIVSTQEKLKLLSTHVKNKFIAWAENEKKMNEELTKTQKVVAALSQLLSQSKGQKIQDNGDVVVADKAISSRGHNQKRNKLDSRLWKRRNVVGRCNDCGKPFSSWHELYKHNRTVHTIQRSKKTLQRLGPFKATKPASPQNPVPALKICLKKCQSQQSSDSWKILSALENQLPISPPNSIITGDENVVEGQQQREPVTSSGIAVEMDSSPTTTTTPEVTIPKSTKSGHNETATPAEPNIPGTSALTAYTSSKHLNIQRQSFTPQIGNHNEPCENVAVDPVEREQIQKSHSAPSWSPPTFDTIKMELPEDLLSERCNPSIADDNSLRPKHGVNWSKHKLGFFCNCGHQSSKKENLRQHLIYYTSPNQFKCSVCPRMFKFTSHLRQHMQKAHNMTCELNGCRQCGQLFQTINALKEHQLVEHKRMKRKRKAEEIDLTIRQNGDDGPLPPSTPPVLKKEVPRGNNPSPPPQETTPPINTSTSSPSSPTTSSMLFLVHE